MLSPDHLGPTSGRVVLDFTEYQELRDAMAWARGNLACYEDGGTPQYPNGADKLLDAGALLEAARWRTERLSADLPKYEQAGIRFQEPSMAGPRYRFTANVRPPQNDHEVPVFVRVPAPSEEDK